MLLLLIENFNLRTLTNRIDGSIVIRGNLFRYLSHRKFLLSKQQLVQFEEDGVDVDDTLQQCLQYLQKFSTLYVACILTQAILL